MLLIMHRQEDFNPSPLTGRNERNSKVDEFIHFNPSPLTGRNDILLNTYTETEFQSISPYGEKLNSVIYFFHIHISIHLPLRGETESTVGKDGER